MIKINYNNYNQNPHKEIERLTTPQQFSTMQKRKYLKTNTCKLLAVAGFASLAMAGVLSGHHRNKYNKEDVMTAFDREFEGGHKLMDLSITDPRVRLS